MVSLLVKFDRFVQLKSVTLLADVSVCHFSEI
jgi:hypothetical protein